MIIPSRRAILTFIDVPAGQPMTLPHVQGAAPIFQSRNNAAFTVESDDEEVTVTNTGGAEASCLAYLFYF